ncbi:glycosyltransferase [Poseidonibacter lekithochrous]|uniref:glycosyltransferase n=1 Tax=Poseidonibacter lekithochrous TaxID=1904463 RepID=UPI000D3DB951|nr:glycosyltransferase [Poseidonibacter lekithochrous]
MKISLIVPSFYPAIIYGGPIFSTLNTSKELARLSDIEVYVSTTNANMTSKLDVVTGKYIKLEKKLNVKYYDETVINKISLSFIFGIIKDIQSSDVVHIQSIFSISTPISLYFAKKYKKPILLSPRGQFGEWCLDNGSSIKGKWLKYFIKPFNDIVIWHATAQQEKDEILSIFSTAKVEIIPNGIYVDEFKKYNIIDKKKYLKKYLRINIKNIDKIIVSMGRLQKKKGFDILIDSFFELLKEYPNSYLLIAGPDEGEKVNLIKQIEKLGLNEKVYLIGNIKDQNKIDFLSNADLFVLPSHNENFGNVYLESLAAGTPIVASTNTPWSEVEEFNCGKWVSNSVYETSRALIDIIKRDRKEMRKNSIRLASKYDWSDIASQFKILYERMYK